MGPSSGPFRLDSDSITRSAQATYQYVRSISDVCQRCRSLTLIRVLPAAHPSTAESNLLDALCTGSLRSLQSEHLNLVVSSLTLLDSSTGISLDTPLEAILASEVKPSDLYLSGEGLLLSRCTQSIRLGIENIQPSPEDSQWKCVYVFGGASALSLECLRAVLSPDSEVHLFGRRSYDRIYDAIPSLRHCTDLKLHVLENEPEHCSDLKLLRRRIAYLGSQMELAGAIETLQPLCAGVHYHACDITDSQALASCLDYLGHASVMPTAILFAAGLLRDGLIVNKSEQDFVDVVSTKCLGLANVLRLTPLDQCQSLYVFGSVSGTYGNKGQTDYSAANEALYRLANLFSESHPELKTVVFNWGPWAEVGMALPEVNAQFARRGISPLTNQQGLTCFLYVANLPGGGFHSPVCGFAPWNDLECTFNTGLSPDLGSIYQLRSRLPHSGSALRLFRSVSTSAERSHFFELNLPDRPLFRDHVLGDQFVLPFAFFVEVFLDACIDLHQGAQLVVHDIRCLRGVQVPLSTQSLVISLSFDYPDGDGSREATIYVGDSRFPSYSGKFVVAAIPPVPTNATLGDTPMPGASSLSPSDCYRDYLFHGSVYQVIERLLSVTHHSIKADVMLSGVPNDLGLLSGHFWICPPPLYDCVAQLALVWRRLFDDKTALPSSVSSLVILDSSKLTGMLEIRLFNIEATDLDMTFDVCIYGPGDELLVYAVSMVCSCSSALKRLNTEWLASVRRSMLSQGSRALL
ncbi:MAG: KR domain-containing protein [Cyanobacteriota bacterium]|jgi:NAD(P)-dependent dehydrogenase (short-subunit alcohol dehydrogenase family)